MTHDRIRSARAIRPGRNCEIALADDQVDARRTHALPDRGDRPARLRDRTRHRLVAFLPSADTGDRLVARNGPGARHRRGGEPELVPGRRDGALQWLCLLYTSDAADERSSVDLGGRRI